MAILSQYFSHRTAGFISSGRQINAEDRGGYRETATYASDKAALPPRGVFTGVQDARDPPSDQCA